MFLHGLALILAAGGTMPVNAVHTGTWYGKPPLKRLELLVTAKNQTGRSRWLFLPGKVGASGPGGVNGVTVYETPAWLWKIEGMGGGWAVQLPPGGDVTLKGLTLSSWYSELPPRVTITAIVADDIAIGGEPIAKFVGGVRTTGGSVDARIDSMRTKVALFKNTETGEEGLSRDVALDFAGRQEVPVTVELQTNPGDWPESFSGRLGNTITLDGTAFESKEGPLLAEGRRQIWVDRVTGWPVGKRVRVTGTVIERYDRPVFTEKPGEPIRSGVPVPEGTDLRSASHRYLLGNVSWTLTEGN